jgi:thiol-disulfide isomerase/thioredoxin
MGDFLREHAAHLAAWGRAGAVVAASLGVLGLVYLARANTARAWAPHIRARARLALLNVLGLAGAGLVVTFGPMTPLFGTARDLAHAMGSPAPDISFRVVETGAARRLHELRGKVVLVNLWATWCPPCLVELPALDALQSAYRDRGLVVLTLTDQDAGEVREALARLAPGTLNGAVADFGWLAVRDFRPFTLVLDRQGVLRDYFFGAQTQETFEARIRPYL